MIQRSAPIWLCVFVLALAACESAEKDTSTAPAGGPVVTGDNPNDARGRNLEIWSDPRFEAQFAESYIAATEIEPTLTSVEKERMFEVMQLLRPADSEEGEDAPDLDSEAALQAEAQRMAQAIEKLQAYRGKAASAVFDFTLGNIYFQQDQLDEAAGAYVAAVRKHKKFRRAWRALGLVYIRQSRWEKAIESLTKVIELGGNDGITYGLMGFAYSSLNNPLSAESAYRQAILLEPDTPDWKMGLARSFFRQNRYVDAVALTGQLIESQPDNADLWMLQANAYLNMDKPLLAAQNFEVVDQLGKSTPDTLNILGDIYVNQGLFDVAITPYVRALKMKDDLKPDRAIRAARVIAARGELEQMGQLVDQIKELRGQMLTDEQKKDLLKLEARLAVASGDADKEAEILRQIVKLDPLDGEALILLGKHAQRGDDKEQAAFYYERAEQLPDFEADALVAHAQLLASQQKYTEALRKLRRAQEIKPRQNVQEYLEQVERVAK